MVAFLEGPELLIVLVIVLLVFGGSKIPQLARSLGQAQKEFQRAARGDDELAARPAPPEPASPGDPAPKDARTGPGDSISFS